MIALTQTHSAGFATWGEANASTEVPGNCLQTAVASLLELPLDMVPHFAVFGNNWGGALTLWLSGRGARFVAYTDDPDTVAYFDYWSFESRPLGEAPADELLIATGPSWNGPWGHVVLWQAGALVHDPHPSGRGIAGEPFEFWQITPEAVAA